MKLTFFSAALPLTKTISNRAGVIDKSGYPNLKKFTSHEVEANSVLDMYKAIFEYAQKPNKPCLLKGGTDRPLTNEPRKGRMPKETPSEWVCFDLDGAPFSAPSEFRRAMQLLGVPLYDVNQPPITILPSLWSAIE